MTDSLNRRDFVAAAGAAAAATALHAAVDPLKILNYNPDMEYRRLGKTGLMVSAVCLGGHWKRLGVYMSKPFTGSGASPEDAENIKDPEFLRLRSEVVTRSIEKGINYVDACSPEEILTYGKVTKGRRDKIFFGFSWHTR